MPRGGPRPMCSVPGTIKFPAIHVAEGRENALSDLQSAFVAQLARMIGPATAAEVAAACWAADPRASAESYRKRAKECIRFGAVIECGRKVCSISGKTCTAYTVPIYSNL